MADHLRLLSFGSDFHWGEVSPDLVLLTQCIMGVRRRFDYIVRMLDCHEGMITFQIRDARNSILPGSARAFIDEINYLTSGAFQWMILDENSEKETIGVMLKSQSESIRESSNSTLKARDEPSVETVTSEKQ